MHLKKMLKYNVSSLRCPFFVTHRGRMTAGAPSLSGSKAISSQTVSCLLEELSTQDLVGIGAHIFLILHSAFC